MSESWNWWKEVFGVVGRFWSGFLEDKSARIEREKRISMFLSKAHVEFRIAPKASSSSRKLLPVIFLAGCFCFVKPLKRAAKGFGPGLGDFLSKTSLWDSTVGVSIPNPRKNIFGGITPVPLPMPKLC